MAKKTDVSVQKKQSHDPFSFFRDEMNRLFEQSFGPRGSLLKSGDMTLSPSLDIKENDKSYSVTAELPGVSEKDVELEVANRVLSIRGEKREEKEEKGEKGYHLMERRYGSFLRSVTLPDDVDENKIDASISDGVLKVVLPKTKESSTGKKKIEIKPGG